MEPTNGNAPQLNEARPRKRQRQAGDSSESMNIHPDLQAAAGVTLSDSLQQSLRQNLDPDSPDYPRRRAVIACEVCRGRKSRCDGGKPKCRLCTDLGAECIYREPGHKLDAGDKLILDQLNRIEGLLHHVGQGIPLGGAYPDQSRSQTTRSRPHKAAMGLFDDIANGIMTANLLSQPLSHNTPLSAELSRIDSPAAITAPLDHAAIATRIESYFLRMHELHGLVNPNTWQAVYATASLANFGRSIEACTVLLLAALGSCASERRLLGLSSPEDAPGAAYFARAWSMLPELSFSNSVAAIQCLTLGALYLIDIYRPLDAWNALTLATSKLDLHLTAFPDPFGPEFEQIKRIYWNLTLIRWNLISSLDLAALGEEKPTSSAMDMPLPFPSNKPDGEEDDPSLLVAQISLQQLAERASKALSSHTSSPANLDIILPVAASFDEKLNEWYESLPHLLRFPQEGFPSGGAGQNALRHGFFACRAAIFRPFVLALVQNPDFANDHSLTLLCKKCLEASVRQIEYTSALHAEQLGWKTANDIVAEALFILAATLSPALAAMLPPAEDLKTRLIDHVVTEIDKLGPGSPVLAVKVSILQAAEDKRQGILHNSGALQA